eukprot:TRINITY_DN40569_c0_g1_i1.p1 TRINITY_DN40569_c0_g1~~TRINITY_DN40569_c0_g1_i1.p1  ORF type:complete len:182 (-),score=30.68 TRINITY_DN40569_c0_g1_i1:68-613(-)
MVKYSKQVQGDEKIAKASGRNLRVSFKNTRETAAAISGMNLQKAQLYLKNVIAHKDIIPFTRYNGGVGRAAQAKKYGVPQGRWPLKSCKFLLDLLQNAEANADANSMDVEELVVSHIQVNQAPQMRRRTYRAHGRINAYRSSPSHIELIVSKKAEIVSNGDVKVLRANGGKLSAGVSAESL